ncbi:DUF6527 family protein [Hoeflea sp.]|jgi:hypothetical protein|uniref:DUF6527 family protein n=1 Tax=Hoeflea sp. TaxID=1940281 RepID=UPI003B5285D0
MKLPLWFLKLWAKIAPARKMIVVDADTPPDIIRTRDIFLARDDGDDWAVALRCPCGCGDRLELLLIPEARPRWSVRLEASGYPTLHPSIWRKTGCRSHFWIRDGRIKWC